jgi:hypothetical protein
VLLAKAKFLLIGVAAVFGLAILKLRRQATVTAPPAE